MLPIRLIRPKLNLNLNRKCLSSLTGNRNQNAQELEESEINGKNLRLPPCQMPNMMDIGARSIFNEDQDMFRENVRRFMREEVYPNHKRYEAQGHVDRELWKLLGQQGLLGKIPFFCVFRTVRSCSS